MRINKLSCEPHYKMKTLIIAFDGMAYRLLKKYNCKTIMQKEFGEIDIDIGLKKNMTSPLFASFLTGKKPEEHGVTRLKYWTNRTIDKLWLGLSNMPGFIKYNAVLKEVIENIRSLNAFYQYPDKRWLKCETIFEKIGGSVGVGIPGWNFKVTSSLQRLVHRLGVPRTVEHLSERFFWVKRKGKRIIREGEKQLIMLYTHEPDHLQHIFLKKNKNEGIIKNWYEKCEEMTKELKNLALEKGYEWILIFSDHGVPSSEVFHTPNAFYSSNLPLFDSKPHITDFYRVILKRCQSKKEKIRSRIKGIKNKLSF